LGSKRKRRRRIIIIGVSLGCIIVAVPFYLQYWLDTHLSDILNEGSEYNIQFEGVHLKPLKQKLLINDIEIKQVNDSDSSDAPAGITSTVEAFSIQGVNVWKLYFNREIVAEELAVVQPDVRLSIRPNQKFSKDSREFNLFLKEVLNRILVKNLVVNRGRFKAIDATENDSIIDLRHLEVSIENIYIDTTTIHDPIPVKFEYSYLECEDIYVKMNSLYEVYAQKLVFDNKVMVIDSLRLHPRFEKREWSQQVTYQQDRIAVQTHQVKIDNILWGFDSDKLYIEASHLGITDFDLHAFKNKQLPEPPYTYKPLLNSLLHKLPFWITLDTLTVSNSQIVYEERPVVHPYTGSITFNEVYATIYNITNDPERLRENPQITLDVISQFMDKGDLELRLVLHMLSENDQFMTKGTLGKMSMQDLNDAIRPLVGVEVLGDLHQLDFYIEGNAQHSYGTLQFDYEDLKIEVFDDDKEKKWLLSQLGTLALKNNNFPEKSNYKEGEIYFTRIPNKSFLNLFWNSIRVGVVDIINPFHSNPDKKVILEEENLRDVGKK